MIREREMSVLQKRWASIALCRITYCEKDIVDGRERKKGPNKVDSKRFP